MMGECLCCEESMRRGVQATVCDGSSKTIVIDVIAQGEKGDKGDSAELTEEQMQEIKDSVSDTLIGAIPEDELLRML
ncbi:hypothetical protein [Murdochiella massiliensis]|uniref:hypothetical protein n=1 Tax=Murdochiella massiliensis TaxID=1673723 RepID=UPI00082BB5EB|nr:hypothetical protein [Murdochiella massiliensis]